VHIGPALSRSGTSWEGGCAWGAGTGFDSTAIGGVRMPPSRFLGNVRGLKLNQKTSQPATADYTGQGLSCDATINDGASISFTMLCQSKANLALQLGASIVQTASRVIVHDIPSCGQFIECDSLLPVDVGPVDQLQPFKLDVMKGGIVISTLVEDVDFERTYMGASMLKNLTLLENQYLRVSYTAEAGTSLSESTQYPCPVSLSFDGFDAAKKKCGDKEKFFSARFFNVSLVPDQNFDLIQENSFQEIGFTGLLKPVKFGKKYIRYQITRPV
jgi:hypothetical protein